MKCMKLNQNGEAVVSDDTAYLYERSVKNI